MTDYIEFEGKTIDQALEKASLEIGQPVDNIEYDVVSYGSSGIFGLVGVKQAKIRVKSQEKRIPGEIRKTARQQARDLVNDTFQIEENEKPADEAAPEGPPELEKARVAGQEALQRMVDFITEGAAIQTEYNNNRLLFKVEGGNSSLLIGKRGQTLEAMQYLVEKIINKKNDQRVRVLVDVEGYLNTREANLKKLASRMAEKAERINKPVTIGQMNAYDRRIVHVHLKDNHAVRTQSMGEGYYRKLVILPKKRRRNKQYN